MEERRNNEEEQTSKQAMRDRARETPRKQARCESNRSAEFDHPRREHKRGAKVSERARVRPRRMSKKPFRNRSTQQWKSQEKAIRGTKTTDEEEKEETKKKEQNDGRRGQRATAVAESSLAAVKIGNGMEMRK
jgi:hypothetical protein